MDDKRYPDGKLNDHDEGETEIAIGEENNCVVIKFEKPITWLALPPDQAMELAVLIMIHARKLGAESHKSSSNLPEFAVVIPNKL